MDVHSGKGTPNLSGVILKLDKKSWDTQEE